MKYKLFLFTWTILPIIIGNIERGNLKILKRLSETKATVLSKRLFSSISIYVAKDTSDTYKMYEKKERKNKENKRINKNKNHFHV